jgi:tetratricopeptide (TPR) repeat protein
VTDAFAEALRLHRAGALAEAEALYHRVLAGRPGHVEALHNLGVLARQTGRDALAADIFARALALEDANPTLHAALGVTLRRLGRTAEAAEAWRRAIALKPDQAETHFNLGNALKDLDQPSAAAEAYRQAAVLKPDLVEAHHNLGGVLLDQGLAAEAASAYRRAIALRPALAEAHNNLGNALKDLGDLDGAARAYRRAIALGPGLGEPHYNLGSVLDGLGRRAEAADAYRRAIALRPDYPEAHNNLGAVLAAWGELTEAMEAYRQAIALRPAYAEAHYNLGNALKERGELDAAASAYRQAVVLRPDHAGAHYHLASLKRMSDGSAEAEAAFAALSRQAESADRLPPAARATLLFALGKALEDRRAPDQAFEALSRANAVHRASISFDVALAESRMRALASVFDRPLLERLAGAGVDDPRPVFILGMPRSGTTLTEQILSAHPAVLGLGEVSYLPDALERLVGPDGEAAPAWARALTEADVRAIGQAYVEKLPPGAAAPRRVVDKLPSNFQRLGLIHLAFPQARIVHCRRDPRDVCVSCYGTHFRDGLDYAYDLTELGRYWRAYDALMDHWRATLPAGRMLEVPYEAVVADLETWARRLIAHCGLPWDDACLNFHQSRRDVRTASSAQVRRPIYADSVGRWRRFEAHLGPLLEALGEPWSNLTDSPAA